MTCDSELCAADVNVCVVSMLINSPARTLVVIEWRGGGGGNHVDLHTVFVLLYSVCHSVNVTSFFFFYLWM